LPLPETGEDFLFLLLPSVMFPEEIDGMLNPFRKGFKQPIFL